MPGLLDTTRRVSAVIAVQEAGMVAVRRLESSPRSVRERSEVPQELGNVPLRELRLRSRDSREVIPEIEEGRVPRNLRKQKGEERTNLAIVVVGR